MSFPAEVAIYVGRAREFRRADWIVYVAWVGLMVGLCIRPGHRRHHSAAYFNRRNDAEPVLSHWTAEHAGRRNPS